MSARTLLILAGLVAAVPAAAGEMKPEEARRFIVGKLFSYTCFDGTSGTGRIFTDGSVAGTIRPQGAGPVRYAMLPAGTIRVKPEAVCASLKGLPWEPCFNLVQTDANTVRGSLRGFALGHCTFTRRHARTNIARALGPLPLRAATTGGPGSD